MIKLTKTRLAAIIATIFAFASIAQYNYITELNAELSAKQKQLSGLKTYNHTLQKKMRRMSEQGSKSGFYAQSFEHTDKS